MELLNSVFAGKPLVEWLMFLGVVAGLLALDLGVFSRRPAQAPSLKKSLLSSAFYVLMAVAFGVWVYFDMGAALAKAYLTGYIVELTLSFDNIFVMSLIFSYLSVPAQYQHRVLFWGILGAVILRGVMIALGATLVANFSWVLYLFAIFLVVTGVKMLFSRGETHDIAHNPLLTYLRRHFKLTPQLYGNKFFVQLPDAKGRLVRHLTPLFVALVLVEFADVLFAVDSVPAIFAITTDPFIVFTSNIFAILGLRSLYFSLSAIIDRFKYLKVSLALVLVFIGGKVLLAPLLGISHVPEGISLGVTVVLLAGGVVFSLAMGRLK